MNMATIAKSTAVKFFYLGCIAFKYFLLGFGSSLLVVTIVPAIRYILFNFFPVIDRFYCKKTQSY
jgi:hypothetical protein